MIKDIYQTWGELVRKHTRGGACNFQDAANELAELVAAAEREACAKVVEASPSYDWHRFACEAAAAIRARGAKPA
jgi:hypothetical protein